MRRAKKQQGGFAMFVVVMAVAMTSLVGVALLDMVQLDVLISGNERRSVEAREVAEGALMEIINDEDTPNRLPMLDAPNLRVEHTAGTNSPFSDNTATAELLRIVPITESSHTYSRAIVHEISVESDVAHGESGFEVSAEIYRTASFRPGMVLPRRHSR